MKNFKETPLSREEIDHWTIEHSGLNARVTHCLTHAGVQTIGELRDWDDKKLLGLDHFGANSLKNVKWFFHWAKKLTAGHCDLPHFRALLQEFLNRQEIFVVEQRYGLTDPLFRPQLKRVTLQEIAHMRGKVTRERVRQVEEEALRKLRSSLCRAVAKVQGEHWVERIQGNGCVVASGELADWVDDPMLGGYKPWGTLLLLTEINGQIIFRYDYFSTLPNHVLNQVEKQILELLHAATEPVSFETILTTVWDELNLLNGERPRLVSVLLEHHPEISSTVDRRYFIPSVGASRVLVNILQDQQQPLHFHELTRLYNERMQPHSRKGTGYILRVLNVMGDAQRVSRAHYQLKK